ncbi:MAG: hypothetical protein ABR593_11035 [Candidatus Limnocylindria bacterium]
MTQSREEKGSVRRVQTYEWRRFGFGGPPKPWDHDAQRDLDRLATSYYLDILESHRSILALNPAVDLRQRVDDLLATAARQKREVDYTLLHWATLVERARVEDRLGSLMRIGIRLREIRAAPPVAAPVPGA